MLYLTPCLCISGDLKLETALLYASIATVHCDEKETYSKVSLFRFKGWSMVINSRLQSVVRDS